jgi:hypothetical protein
MNLINSIFDLQPSLVSPPQPIPACTASTHLLPTDHPSDRKLSSAQQAQILMITSSSWNLMITSSSSVSLRTILTGGLSTTVGQTTPGHFTNGAQSSSFPCLRHFLRALTASFWSSLPHNSLVSGVSVTTTEAPSSSESDPQPFPVGVSPALSPKDSGL